MMHLNHLNYFDKVAIFPVLNVQEGRVPRPSSRCIAGASGSAFNHSLRPLVLRRPD